MPARSRRRRCAPPSAATAGLGGFFVLTGLMLVLAIGHRLSLGGSALFLGLVLAAKPYADRYVDRALRRRRGARAEIAVGETLDELLCEGWIVIHDVEQPREGTRAEATRIVEADALGAKTAPTEHSTPTARAPSLAPRDPSSAREASRSAGTPRQAHRTTNPQTCANTLDQSHALTLTESQALHHAPRI